MRSQVSPARQVPDAFGTFRWNRKQLFFDNRKAGKSTPITWYGLRSARGSDGVDYYKFCSS